MMLHTVDGRRHFIGVKRGQSGQSRSLQAELKTTPSKTKAFFSVIVELATESLSCIWEDEKGYICGNTG
jgi:hypothetical protein